MHELFVEMHAVSRVHMPSVLWNGWSIRNNESFRVLLVGLSPDTSVDLGPSGHQTAAIRKASDAANTQPNAACVEIGYP